MERESMIDCFYLKLYLCEDFLAFSTDMTNIVPSITFLLVVLYHSLLHTVRVFSIDSNIKFELPSNWIYREI